MKNLLGISIMFFFILTGCQKDIEQDQMIPLDQNQYSAELILSPLLFYQADPDLLKATHQKRENSVERPIKFRSEGTLAYIFNSEACGDDATTMINQTVIEGSGHGSHMGHISIHLSYCWIPTGSPENPGISLLSPPMGSAVAANGDRIFVMMVGAGMDDKGAFQNYLILNGTGRFKDATGSYTLYGVVDYDNLVFWHEGEGVIVY